MRISGAIFDMGGTLIDPLMLWDILWKNFSRRFCGGHPFRRDGQIHPHPSFE